MIQRLLLLAALSWISMGGFAQDSYLTPFKRLVKKLDGKIEVLSFSHDNKFLAAVDNSGAIAVWDLQSNAPVRGWQVSKCLFLKFQSNGDLVTVNSAGEIRVFSSGTFAEKSVMKFSGSVSAVNIDPSGQTIFGLLKDGVELFSLKALMLENRITFTTGLKKIVFIGFDRFGQQLSIVTETGQVLSWNPTNLKLLRELKLKSGEYSGSRSVVQSATNTFGGDRIIVGMQEVFIPKGGFQGRNQLERRNLLVFYDWVSGQETKRIPIRYRADKVIAGAGASNLAYFSNDALSIWLVNYDRGEIMSSIKLNEDPNSICFAEDNELFAVGSTKGNLDLYYIERNVPAEIKIQAPSLDRSYATETTGQDQTLVKGTIEGATRVNKISINGQLVENNFSSSFEGNVVLSPGKNRIRVTAETSEQKQIVKDFYINCDPSKRVAANQKQGSTGKRVALIIGNANYQHTSRLNNTMNDAKLMEKTLSGLGFEVLMVLDGSYEAMKNSIYAFGDKIADVDISLFYYAGHGLEVDGTNYLVPIDADIQSALDVKQKSIPLPGVLRTMEFTNEEGLNMIVLDACRNNPFPTGKRGGSGLSRVNAPSGTLIAYATDPGSTASDGEGVNGLYTGVLAEQMKISQRIEDIFMNTRNKVEEISKGSQRPWEEARLKGVFYLK